MLRTGILVLESAFSGVFLWLGLYLITRDSPGRGQEARRWWQRPALAAGVAMIGVAWFLLGVAIQAITEEPRAVILWQRLTWWGGLLACPFYSWALFLVTTEPLSSQRASHWAGIVSLLLLTYAIGIAVVGSTTSLLFDYGAIRRVSRAVQNLEVPPQLPAYALEVVPILGMLLTSVFLLLRRYYASRDAAREQFRWLGVGTVMLALGAAIGTAGVAFPSWGLPPELGDVLLVVGLFLIGYGVARHNALFQQRVITRDFYRSLASVAVTSAVFVLAFAGVHALTPSALTPESIPLLIWLATLAVTLRPWVSERLDRLFFPRRAALVREALNQASDRLATAGDQHRALLEIEREVPEMITARLQEHDLREVQEGINRDIAKLLSGTNYKRADSGDFIARETTLLGLAVVEETTTTLMKRDGFSPAVDREHYRLRALREIIRELVEDLGAEVPKTDVKGDEYRNRRGQYLILRRQFLDGVPRKEVEQLVHRELSIAPGGSYGRLLGHAKTELGRRLYLEERLARETRERGRQRGAT